jgi:2,4-dienoyl-CoA reductase-like NADH-dependent reductase (Old Yellow Enzyme family)
VLILHTQGLRIAAFITMSVLLQPTSIGALSLRNRITMSALTRNRNIDNLKPGPASIEYYSQRATAGLIISEGILVCPLETPWPFAPVMCSEEHAVAWEKVVDAVQDRGGKIFMQAWHVGANKDLSLDGLGETIGAFRRAAELAKRAGFDGVEVLAQG